MVDDIKVTKCASLAANGVTVDMSTSYPGVQVYTGNWLEGKFQQHGGVALEGQYYPDCVGASIEGKGEVWKGKVGDKCKEVISFAIR